MSKLYISADIEGVACISSPNEGDIAQQFEYTPFRDQMTAEVAAACTGAYSAGVQSILVKDAHGTGRNINPKGLVTPQGRELRLIRGWSGHPFAMVQEIDRSFNAAAFLGFHSAAAHGGNPLAHTISGKMFARVELNDVLASELRIYAFAAATVGVPLVFLSGDQALCEEAHAFIDGITTVATLQGAGSSSVSMLPDHAVRSIAAGIAKALTTTLPPPPKLPSDFCLRLTFARARDAYAKSFYPGAALVSDTTVKLESRQYLDILTFLWFAAA